MATCKVSWDMGAVRDHIKHPLNGLKEGRHLNGGFCSSLGIGTGLGVTLR